MPKEYIIHSSEEGQEFKITGQTKRPVLPRGRFIVTVHGRADWLKSIPTGIDYSSLPRIVATIDKKIVKYRTVIDRYVSIEIDKLNMTIHSPFVERALCIKNKEFYIVLFKKNDIVTLYNIDQNQIITTKDDFESGFLPVPEKADILEKMIRIKTEDTDKEVILKLKEILVVCEVIVRYCISKKYASYL